MHTKAKRQTIIQIVVSIIVILFIYAIIQLVIFLKKPTNLTLVKNGTIIEYEEVTGYVIRDEELIDTSKYTGIPELVVQDGERVSKNGTVISYVSREEEKIVNKITELDSKIQDAMESRQEIYTADVKNLDSTIQTNIYDAIKHKSDVYEAKEYKTTINNSVEKKAKIVGELSPSGSKIKELINERLNYEIELNKSKQDLKSNMAGLVSYRVDNYENILTPNSFSSLSISKLDKMKFGTDQIIPLSNDKAKVINNFVCYIAVPMKTEKSKELSLNSTVKLKFDNMYDEYVKSTVEYISDEENGERLVIFKITTNVEELSKYRKITFDVVWWSENGLKVPNSAITYETITDAIGKEIATLPTVTVIESTYEEKTWVKVIKSTSKFSIIENYKDAELIEMGIDEDTVKNRNEIRMYDQVIVH